jgi:hypothetical protein
MLALAPNAVVCMGGQGARRARKWRHNQAGSLYQLPRIASLCPAQQVEAVRLEQQRRVEEAQRIKAEKKQARVGAGENDC